MRKFATEFRLVSCNYSGIIRPIRCGNCKLIHTLLQNIALGENSNSEALHVALVKLLSLC